MGGYREGKAEVLEAQSSKAETEQNTVGSNGASIIGDAPATNMGCSGGT